MDATTTTSKRARDDSESEFESTPVSLTHEPAQSGEPHQHQAQSERDDTPNGGRQDSARDGSQQPPRKKNRRYKQQQRHARQDCTYCLDAGKTEFASGHPLTECHWKKASDAMNAYELAEGIHRQKFEGELAAVKALHDTEIKTLKNQHDAQVQNLNARVANLQAKNDDMTDRIKILTEENDFLTAEIDYVRDDMDRMAEANTKALDGLAAQRDKELAVLTEQREKERADFQGRIDLMKKEKMRLIDGNQQLRRTLTQRHGEETDKLLRIIESLEVQLDENHLMAQHRAEIKMLEKRHKRDTEEIAAKLENEHEYKTKQLQEANQAELWNMEHKYEDEIDLIRYENEEMVSQLQRDLTEEQAARVKLRGELAWLQENCSRLRQELAEAREKTQALAKDKIQLLMEKKAAPERPKLDGHLQHRVEKLKKEVEMYEVMASDFREDREIYQRKIRDLEDDLGSSMSVTRVLKSLLREKGVTDQEIEARFGASTMGWDLDAESSNKSGVESAVTDSEFEPNTYSDSEPEKDTDVEMREGDTDVDEEEEYEEGEEEEEEQEEESAVDREDSFHGFDSEGARPDSADEDMSDVVSESTELDEGEVENKSVQDGGEGSSSGGHEAVAGSEEGSVSSPSREESDLLEDVEEDDVSPPSPVTAPLLATESRPYNPAAPIIPIPPLNHMPITVGERARQMTYFHDLHSYLSGGCWVETVNMNATPIPQQQQQRSTNPTPTPAVLNRQQYDDDESTTLDF